MSVDTVGRFLYGIAFHMQSKICVVVVVSVARERACHSYATSSLSYTYSFRFHNGNRYVEIHMSAADIGKEHTPQGECMVSAVKHGFLFPVTNWP